MAIQYTPEQRIVQLRDELGLRSTFDSPVQNLMGVLGAVPSARQRRLSPDSIAVFDRWLRKVVRLTSAVDKPIVRTEISSTLVEHYSYSKQDVNAWQKALNEAADRSAISEHLCWRMFDLEGTTERGNPTCVLVLDFWRPK